MLDAARGVVADLAHRISQFQRAQGEEVGSNNLIFQYGRWPGSQAFADNLPEAHLAGVLIMPELAQDFLVHRFHERSSDWRSLFLLPLQPLLYPAARGELQDYPQTQQHAQSQG